MIQIAGVVTVAPDLVKDEGHGRVKDTADGQAAGRQEETEETETEPSDQADAAKTMNCLLLLRTVCALTLLELFSDSVKTEMSKIKFCACCNTLCIVTDSIRFVCHLNEQVKVWSIQMIVILKQMFFAEVNDEFKFSVFLFLFSSV